MTGFRFVLALGALPLIGYPFLRFPAFRSLHSAARGGVAAALGATVLCAQMLLLTWLGLRWSVWLLLILPVLFAFARRGFRAPPPTRDEEHGRGWAAFSGRLALVVALATLGVTTYAAATARATSSDLLLFWGTKGQRFAQAAGIDVGFLRDPAHFLMHVDYPPLLPCLYAWAAMVAGRFAWGATLLSLPLFLALAVVTFFGFARPVLGRRVALEYASLLAALLGFVLIQSYTAGNADPLLAYFEVLVLSAIVFALDRPEGFPSAAIGLAGGVLSKMEGLVFAVLVIVGAVLFIRDTRRARSLALLVGAPAVTLGAWVLFCWSHGLLAVYLLPARSKLALGHIPLVLREVGLNASYGAWFAPWVVIFVLLVWGMPTRASLVTLAVTLGFGAFIVYTYLTISQDPSEWIVWSASRLLITPLLCLFFGAMATASGASPSDS